MSGITRRQAYGILAALLLVFFAPVLFSGEVIYPHDNVRELRAEALPRSSALTQRRLRDLSSVYVPTVHHHLAQTGAGWLATWNPQVELGRPATHLGGFGRSFPLTWLLSLASHDALTVHTWLSLSAVVLAAVFGLAFLLSLGLHPAAALTGTLGLALGVSTTIWLSVQLFLWPITWALGLLWAVTRCCERLRIGFLAFIAFAVYALLTTGYPQQVVWQALVVSVFSATRLMRVAHPGRRALTATWLGAALLVGLLCALPLLADLWLEAERSGRTQQVDSAFFLPAIPRLESAAQAGRFVALLHDAFWWGNPLASGYPLPARQLFGVVLTPLTAMLMVCSVFRGRRTASCSPWPWLVLVALGLVLSVWPAAYRFGVEHLGLSFSRFTPIKGVLIPVAVLAALGAERVLRGKRLTPRAFTLVALPFGAALIGGLGVDAPPRATGLLTSGAIALGGLAFLARPRPTLLVTLAVAGVFAYGHRIRLLRPRAEIRERSALVRRMAELTANGTRFAWVGAEPEGALPANQEVTLGLSSIHAYDPLAPRQYRAWVRRLNPHGMALGQWGDWPDMRGAQEYGRQFTRIDDPATLARPELSYAGVGLFLSATTLDANLATLVDEVAGVGLYRPACAPLREAQLARWKTGHTPDEVRLTGRLQAQARFDVERSVDLDDRLLLRTSPRERPTLLFLSQQHHPAWHAFAGTRELRTVRINGLYQGVLLPRGTDAVELRFLPWMRFSWIPALLFPLAAGALLARSVWRRAQRRNVQSDARKTT